MTIYEINRTFNCKKCNNLKESNLLERIWSEVCKGCDDEKTSFKCSLCSSRRVHSGAILFSFITDKQCVDHRFRCDTCNLTMGSSITHHCERNFCEICEEEFIGSRRWFLEHRYNHELEEQLEIEETTTTTIVETRQQTDHFIGEEEVEAVALIEQPPKQN